MGRSTGLLVLELLSTILPYLLDTGIQIWNAVELNILTSNTEFKYPTPLYISEDHNTTTTNVTLVTETENCEEGWTFFPHNNQCYKFVNTKTSWTNATKSCRSNKINSSNAQRPRLVSILDAITNDFLANLGLHNSNSTIGNVTYYSNICSYKCAYAWTGGFQIGLDWYGGHWYEGPPWEGHTEQGYTNWGDGKPSNLSETKDNTYLAMMCGCTNGQDWIHGQWNNVPDSYELPALCQYDPFAEDVSLEPQRRKRQATNDDIFSIDFSIKITVEGLVSLAIVQLPGIVLGFLGIIKAFINNGCSKQAVVDSLRYCA